jgi:hypothetical protein
MTGRRHVVNLRNASIARNHQLQTTDLYPKCSKNKSNQHLSIPESFLLDPELEPQGGDVEGGAQEGGVGGGVRPLKTKVCDLLMVNHPPNVGRNR